MAKFKITMTARYGKDRPAISVVVDAANAKEAQRYVMRACAPGSLCEWEPVEERRPTLKAAV